MREALFPGNAEGSLPGARGGQVLVAELAGGRLGGFLEVSTRDYAEECESSPIAYIEAWYVEPELRRGGLGRALVEAAERWARGRGFREIASDTDLGNELGLDAHRALGYQETARLICFRKDL